MEKSCLTYFAVSLFSLGAAGTAHAGNYIGLMAGNFGTVSDATVTASQSQLICFTPPCSQTASGTAHFNREHSAGIRVGAWYGTFGLASEYTTSGATRN